MAATLSPYPLHLYRSCGGSPHDDACVLHLSSITPLALILSKTLMVAVYMIQVVYLGLIVAMGNKGP